MRDCDNLRGGGGLYSDKVKKVDFRFLLFLHCTFLLKVMLHMIIKILYLKTTWKLMCFHFYHLKYFGFVIKRGGLWEFLSFVMFMDS